MKCRRIKNEEKDVVINEKGEPIGTIKTGMHLDIFPYGKEFEIEVWKEEIKNLETIGKW